MEGFHLAQVNVARLVAPLDSPQLADFVANLDRVNAMAEASPGFVWRLQTDAGDATAVRIFDDEWLIVNLTVWTSVDALREYVYRSGHAEVLRRRQEWFERMAEAHLALWWIPAGTVPTVADAEEALRRVRAHGPTAEAFTLREAFAPTGLRRPAPAP